jgi:hypothetical protein
MQWLPKKEIQISGTGLSLVMGIAPSLHINIPQFVRWIGFFIGMIMIVGPWIKIYFDNNKEQLLGSLWKVILIIFGVACIASEAWYFGPHTSELNEHPETQAYENKKENKREVGDSKTETPNALGPFAGLTNSQLRERTIAFTHTIIDFENSYEVVFYRIIDFRNLSNEQVADRMNLIREKNDAHVAAFRSKYRTEAITIREEIKRRFNGKLPEFPVSPPFVHAIPTLGMQIFEGPILSGPHPISAGADLLDFWASQLP